MTIIEFIAALCGFGAVYLTVKEHIWCWPVGLVQVFLYIFVFLDARLYSDMILHVIYVVLQVYGWHNWLHGGTNSSALRVTALNSRILPWVAIAITASGCWGFLMQRYTDAAAPYPDAFIAAASLVAQYLTTRKNLESWYFWIAVDVVAIIVYWYKGLHLTMALYALFLAMCIIGVRKWRTALLSQSAITPAVVS